MGSCSCWGRGHPSTAGTGRKRWDWPQRPLLPVLDLPSSRARGQAFGESSWRSSPWRLDAQGTGWPGRGTSIHRAACSPGTSLCSPHMADSPPGSGGGLQGRQLASPPAEEEESKELRAGSHRALADPLEQKQTSYAWHRRGQQARLGKELTAVSIQPHPPKAAGPPS